MERHFAFASLTVVFPHSPFEGDAVFLLERKHYSLSLWFSPTAPLKAGKH